MQQHPAALPAFGAFLIAPGGDLWTYENASIEAEYQHKAMKLCVSWEDLQGEMLQHKVMLQY